MIEVKAARVKGFEYGFVDGIWVAAYHWVGVQMGFWEAGTKLEGTLERQVRDSGMIYAEAERATVAVVYCNFVELVLEVQDKMRVGGQDVG